MNEDAILDMREAVQRQASWRFELVDANLQGLGTLGVDRSSPPTMTVDTSRARKRDLTNVRLLPGVIHDVNVITERVRVSMILGDGSLHPQGVFLFTDASQVELTSGAQLDVGAVGMHDQCLIVDQEMRRGVSFGPGSLITDGITSLLAELPIAFNVQPSGAVVNTVEALAWPANTSRLRIVNELAKMIGYHDLFFDNDGIGQLTPMPNPLATSDEHVHHYPDGSRTFRPSILRSTDAVTAPNVFVVINSGPTNAPVVGVYELPPESPHSVANRGYEVPHVETMQGIESQSDAETAARALARTWRFTYETVEFAGPPDPRCDTYDTYELAGIRFLGLQWSQQLMEGAPMNHRVRRTYETESA